MAFGKSSLGRRGYDEESVDAFLDSVSQDMIRLLEENDLLRRRADQADAVRADADRAVSWESSTAELAAVAAEVQRARREFAAADEEARALHGRLEQARHEAATTPREQGSSTGRVLSMAQHTADDHLQSAQQESKELIAKARERSEQIAQQARATADEIEGNARRHHNEAVTELQQKRTALLREIDELAGFAENYRAALESHVVKQIEQLDDAPAAEIEQQPAR